MRGDQCVGRKNSEIAYSCLLHRSEVFNRCSQSSILENLLNYKFSSPTLDLLDQKVWGLGPSNPINRKVLRDTQVWKKTALGLVMAKGTGRSRTNLAMVLQVTGFPEKE